LCTLGLPVSILLLVQLPPTCTLFPYTTLFRSPLPMSTARFRSRGAVFSFLGRRLGETQPPRCTGRPEHAHGHQSGLCSVGAGFRDRKSTRLNSSHVSISYAVFCLKKKTNTKR